MTDLQIPNWKYDPDLTKLPANERELLDKLKVDFPSLDEDSLHRFIVAREANSEKVYAMLQSHMKWRNAHKDKLVEGGKELEKNLVATRGYQCWEDSNGVLASHENIKKLLEYVPATLHKFSRNGMPLLICLAGWVDCSGFAHDFNSKTLLDAVIDLIEVVTRVVIPEGHERYDSHTRGLAIVVDLKDLGLRQFVLETLNLLVIAVQLVEDNYPERLGVIFVINLPKIFQMFWSVISPFIPPRTLARIKFLGSDYLPTVLEVIPPENLPSILGGLCTCRHGTSGCLCWSTSPGYTNPFANGKMIRNIPAKGKEDLPIAITQHDLDKSPTKSFKIHYEFELEDKNVDFALYFMPSFTLPYNDNDLKVLQEKRTIESTDGVIKGVLEANSEGTFIFRWDNTFSYFTSKKILYVLTDEIPKS